MLFSKYFIPIAKETPKDAAIISHILMLKTGMVRQASSGIYSWLPMGLKVLDKVSNIIKTEMNSVGALNILMPTIQSADMWRESERYDSYGLEMLRVKDRHNREFLYGPTNEEQVTQIFRDNIKSYKDLPLNLYQIQWKFRDEIRPRFGVMRGREFLMKDAYSFDLTLEDAEISYKKMFACYLSIFKKMGLKAIPMKADTGPIGGDLSHEFLILANTGESEVFCDDRMLSIEVQLEDYSVNNVKDIFNNYASYYSATSDTHDANDKQYIQNSHNIISQRAIEVGHIFYFADKYSSKMKANILDNQGKNIPVLMGSYGIGVSRLLGAIIEASHDEKGIIWPKAVAPFDVIINSLGSSTEVVEACESLYKDLTAAGFDCLYNDTNDSAGSKLAIADLIGIPYQINIGNKTIKDGALEFKTRVNNQISIMSLYDINLIISKLQQI